MTSGELMRNANTEKVQPRSRQPWPVFRRAWWLIWLFVPLLLWWTLRQVPLAETLVALRGLRGWQIALLLALNTLVLLGMAARWRVLTGGMGLKISLKDLAAYRLAGFGVSYFTPGPQFGGEPLQVYLLARSHHTGTPAAVSSVFLDKLLEILANLLFLTIGVVLIVLSDLLGGFNAGIWLAAGLTLALPAAHLAALWRGKRPVTWLLSRIPHPRFLRARSLADQAESQIAALCVARPGVLALGIIISGAVWLAVLAEYLLMARFLGIPLNLSRGMIALTLAQFAFLMPLPGGLGALEASQVLAMQLLGFNPALGLSISLLIRARDVLFGGAGLVLGGWLARRLAANAARENTDQSLHVL